MPENDLLAVTNERIAYHSRITRQMVAERTSLESRLIPVTAYIVTAAVECWYRYPEMIRFIDSHRRAEEIGAAGGRPGTRVNAVHLWSIANVYLTGRKFLSLFQMADDTVERTHAVLDFWERAARAYQGGGQRQAWDGGGVLRPYGSDLLVEMVEGVTAVGGPTDRDRIRTFNAAVTSYLFLLYFDTRVGTGDAGPYPLPGGQVLLVRDFYQLGPSDFWWSEVAAGVPYRNLTAALVLEGVDVRVNDWGTSITTPEDYLERLVGFALFTTDTPDRSLRPVPLDELGGIVAAIRGAQARLYRNVAAMSRREKIACGAYVYFSFLRPFAEVAGVADELDWTVPRDSLGPVYDAIEPMEGENAAPEDASGEYFSPIARQATGVA